MTRLIFLGPPGAGKGTQAQLLAEYCDVPHISTGDILRSAVDQKTDLGQKAEAFMNSGELVPDDLILDLIRERLHQPDAGKGWILDGFPRNLSQAKFLDELLEGINQPFDSAINLDVPDEVIIARLLKRGRQDDNDSVIRNRLEVYREQTEPVIGFYRDRQRLVSVNGNQELDAVYADMKNIVAT